MSRYVSLPIDDEGTKRLEGATEHFEKLAHYIETKLQNGRAKSIALTHLDTAYKFAVEAAHANTDVSDPKA